MQLIGRLRWFVPIINHRARHYRDLAADDGMGAIVQVTPIINPGEEVSLRCAGKFLTDPHRDITKVIRETVGEVFEPRTQDIVEELADIFWAAEWAYLSNAMLWTDSGEFWLQPLAGDGKVGGPPIYLSARMYSHKLEEYAREMANVQKRFNGIRSELGDQDRAGRLGICLANVIKDVEHVRSRGDHLKYPWATVDENTWS